MKSENSVPLWPCWVKTRGLERTAALGLVKARRRSLVSSGGRGLPCHFWSSGLGSKRSIWLGPPSMNMKMTFLALAAKGGCGRGRGAVPVLEFGLGVEESDLAGAPLHDNEVEVMGLAGKWRLARPQALSA